MNNSMIILILSSSQNYLQLVKMFIQASQDGLQEGTNSSELGQGLVILGLVPTCVSPWAHIAHTVRMQIYYLRALETIII